MLFMPQGILPSLSDWLKRLTRSRGAGRLGPEPGAGQDASSAAKT